jgi:predicted anti-sigma-YlaC factor YlaD
VTDQQLTCEELVELVTDYLEGALTEVDRRRFEEHLVVCGGCSNYLDQVRTTIELTGQVTLDDLMDETKAELLAAFRDWKSR